MDNEKRSKIRLIKTGAIPSARIPCNLIQGNQFFPGIPASCELLPKLRFMRVEASLMLCIQYPGERDFKPVTFTRHPAKVVIAPVLVNATTDADCGAAGGAWPYKAQVDLQSLDARSLREIAELAHETSVLPTEVEAIVKQAFRAGWLDKSTSKRAVWENVAVKCREADIRPPSYQAVATRIDCLFSREVLRFHPLTREGYMEKPGGYPPD